MADSKRYQGDNDHIEISMVMLNFRSYTSYADALSKASKHMSIMEEKDGEPLSSFRWKNINLNYDNGEFRIQIEIVKDIIDLGLKEGVELSEADKAFRLITVV